MIKTTTYVNFEGKCEEAMNFYKDIFDAQIELNRMGDSPMAEGATDEMKNQIIHSTISKDGVALLMASDSMGYPISKGDNVSICVTGDLEEITNIYNKLCEGGTIRMPLKTEYFGTFGDLLDKYGVRWMVQSNQKQA